MKGPVIGRLPEVPIGVQYYRQPTPLPGEWAEDLANIRRMGFDMIQLRPQWRWHERNEGELNFDDLDRLFDLAETNGLKVIFKFFLPCGPKWLFDRYDATRVRPDGTPMLPFTHGAMYIGGFAPCFDKPLVRRKAGRFIRAAVRRYKDRPNLLAWHAWNEPRSRPAEDCACKDSMRLWRAWLKRRFGTIEAFNGFAGLATSGHGNDFSGIDAPVINADYPGWMLFRSFRATMIADRLKWVYDEIRKIDRHRPILSHAGICSIIQDAKEDTSNDYLNARSVDLYGSSCPNTMTNLPMMASQPVAYEGATADLICSRIRGVNNPFWINEVYARSLGWGPQREARYVRQTSYHCLASGAKGILYWQYRAERLTTESAGSGLVDMAGRRTVRTGEAERIVRFVRAHRAELAGSSTPPADVAIPYCFDSDLMSRIETNAPDGEVLEAYPYKASLRGIHLALWELDAQVDIVPSEQFQRLLAYKAVYLPCPRMLSAGQIEVIEKFVRGGGLLIAEPSPGMRDANTWAAPNVPPERLQKLFGCREVSRVRAPYERPLRVTGRALTCPAQVYTTSMEVLKTGAGPRAKIEARWESGEPAIVSAARGKGRAMLLGAPLGEAYFLTRDKAILAWLEAALRRSGVAIEKPLLTRRPDLRTRRLVTADGGEVLFVFNYRDKVCEVTVRRRGFKAIAEMSDLRARFRKVRGGWKTHVPAEEVLIVRLHA